MYPLPLYIECPYGLHQPYHPSVIYREGALFGHQYWMAQTPYPIEDRKPYRDRYENPCVYYSDDGYVWNPIDDNPLDDLTSIEVQQGCYFSDPHLVVRGTVMELFYRFSDRHGTVIYKRFTVDGFHWSDRELVVDLHSKLSHQLFGNDIISPSVIWSKDKGYECWYVDDTYVNTQRKIRYIHSMDGINWSESQLCTYDGDTLPWHLDVQDIAGELNMIVFDVDHQRLDWYVEKTKLDWKYRSRILVPSHRKGDFYECGLYRACVIKVKDVYRVYFSAHNAQESSIGVIETSDRQHFVIRTGQSMIKTTINTLFWYYKSLRRRLRKYII